MWLYCFPLDACCCLLCKFNKKCNIRAYDIKFEVSFLLLSNESHCYEIDAQIIDRLLWLSFPVFPIRNIFRTAFFAPFLDCALNVSWLPVRSRSCDRTRPGGFQGISIVGTGLARLWRQPSVVSGMRASGIPVHRGGWSRRLWFGLPCSRCRSRWARERNSRLPLSTGWRESSLCAMLWHRGCGLWRWTRLYRRLRNRIDTGEDGVDVFLPDGGKAKDDVGTVFWEETVEVVVIVANGCKVVVKGIVGVPWHGGRKDVKSCTV